MNLPTRYSLVFAFICIILLKSLSAFAAPEFSKNHFQIYVYKDLSDTISIEKVRSVLDTNRHLFIPADSIHESYSITGTYWLYLQPASVNDQEYVLKFHVFLSLVEVYPYPFTTVSCYGGLTIPGHLKELSGNTVLLKHDSKGYLIKVQNRVWESGSVKNIEILSFHEFQKKKEKQDLIQAFIQGFFWLMLIYNLVLYFLNRRKIHLHYVMYVFLNSIFLFFLFGYSEIYIFSGNYKLNLCLWTFQLLGSYFYVMFIRIALLTHCSTYTHSFDRRFFLPYIYVRLFMNLIAAGTVFYRFDTFTIASGISNLIGTVAGIFIFIYFYKGSDWFMRTILWGSVILILFGWASLIYVRYHLHSNNLYFETGMLIELLLFTYALNRQHFEERFKSEVSKRLLESELEDKNRTIVYQSIQLSAKDEVLASIKEKLKEMELNGRSQSDLISGSLLIDSMNKSLWKEFEVHFNETHPEFYQLLMEKYPELTQNEIRLCAFLKLNLNTKEIAFITQKSVKSIEVMRSRIRQKMGLQRDANLIQILTQLSKTSYHL